MNKPDQPNAELYHQLIAQIEETVNDGRKKAVVAINQSMVLTYWNIGRHIVQFEQDGKERAEYGTKLLRNLSQDLTARIGGGGYNHTNINYMRMFFLEFPNFWGHCPQNWAGIIS